MKKNLYHNINKMKIAIDKKKKFFYLPFSYSIFSFLHCCYRNGLIRGYRIEDNKILVYLRFYRNESAIKQISLVSKPSKPVYFNYKELFNSFCSRSFVIIETSQGFYNAMECRRKKIGGKILCIVK